MPSTPFFRKSFTTDRDTHTFNLRLLEDTLANPIDATSGSVTGVMSFGDPAGYHVEVGVQTLDGDTYFIVAWQDATTIVTGLLIDGTWT